MTISIPINTWTGNTYAIGFAETLGSKWYWIAVSGF